MLCHLRDKGLLDADFDSDRLAEEEPLLAACYGASVQNIIAFGARAGQRVNRIGNHHNANRGKYIVKSLGNLQASLDGFDLHARQYIPADDREQLERAPRYCARPPISEDRLERLSDGCIQLKLKTPYSDGTTHLMLEPEELLEKLAALIPRPRANLLFYHGVLAPNAKLRKAVVKYGRERPKQPENGAEAATQPAIQEFLEKLQAEAQPGSYLQALEAQELIKSGPNYTWSQLMRRAFRLI